MSFWTRLRYELGAEWRIAKTANVTYWLCGESTEPLIKLKYIEKLSAPQYYSGETYFRHDSDPVLDKKCKTETLRILNEYRMTGIKAQDRSNTITGEHIVQCNFEYNFLWEKVSYDEWLEMGGLRK